MAVNVEKVANCPDKNNPARLNARLPLSSRGASRDNPGREGFYMYYAINTLSITTE